MFSPSAPLKALAVILLACSATVSASASSDYNALQVMYATWGAPASLKTWASHNPCDTTWRGIVCNNGVVVSLAIEDGSFMKPLDPVVGSLTGLTYLDLSSDQITGTLPSTLSKLTNLAQLKLSTNELTGSLPPSLSKLYAALGQTAFVVSTNVGLCGSLDVFPGISTASTGLGLPCPQPAAVPSSTAKPPSPAALAQPSPPSDTQSDSPIVLQPYIIAVPILAFFLVVFLIIACAVVLRIVSQRKSQAVYSPPVGSMPEAPAVDHKKNIETA